MGSDEQRAKQISKGIGLSDVQIGKRREVEDLKKQLADIDEYFKDFDGNTFNEKFHSLCRYYEDMMDEKDADYKKLEKQLAEAHRLYKGAVSVNADNLEKIMATAVHKKNEQLKIYLNKFGGHTAECDSLKIYVMGWKGEYGEKQIMRDPAPKCDCGYKETKERWE